MTIWYPYAQMKTMRDPLEVDYADKEFIYLKDGRTLIDGISSWWCTIHGYNHPRLNAAMAKQMKKMSHIMLGGLTHEPAQKLADKLVAITPEGLNHVFFSDSGSVGCEVALKMAIQYWANQNQKEKSKFIALKKGYHGDTLGVMSVGTDDETMHQAFKHVVPEQYFVTPERLEELEATLKNHHHHIAAFIVEPLLQGAGGLLTHSAAYLKQAKSLCDTYNVLFIFDEVATGFGRTGALFAADQVGITPDIMVLGKALTGGTIGLAATLATTNIFNAFYDDSPEKAFMHGPTFMGNPLACAAALESITIFEDENYLEKIDIINKVLTQDLEDLPNTRIQGAMASIDNINPASPTGDVWLRPIGTTIYTMPPYIVSESSLKKITQTLREIALTK